MPTYIYRCKECGHQFEQRQRMSDDPLTICPVCEGDIRRVVNSVGVVFKGSGFYVTDNRGSNSANSINKSDSSEKDEKSDTANKTKSDTASATSTKDSSQSATSATAAA